MSTDDVEAIQVCAIFSVPSSWPRWAYLCLLVGFFAAAIAQGTAEIVR